MQNVSHISSPTTYATSQGGGANGASPQSGGPSFQAETATMTQPTGLAPTAQGLAAGVSRSLGSQMVSTLLQMQDLDQTQVHGHGGGGGGHRGGMKMMASLETEEATGNEEAQLLKQRKKLADKLSSTELSETLEVDENGVPITQEDQGAGKDKSKQNTRA